ncbi:hypothetical protein PPERSA_12938 [Pseudocohnilembus persalinus]|uniref:Uncharacterized protein n=1 Tax=Pseudocohnilembus persalinus TaxID=266149 RepID=A0A0V0R1Q8_PSEPJ|nr:hypothetical protein PPERSA_12938 [Pseudocohnilembus persalinus]|eukprot:KRX08457.1 hypothetical protein PPERSA_12938 [Pseudocohnilembus persalinus]
MDLQFISQNQEKNSSKKQKRCSIDDDKYDQKQILNQSDSQFQKEQKQYYSLDNKEKNSKKLWRLQEKKEKTQEQIINIIPLGKTFHTFGFNYNDNCDNYKVDGIMQNFSNQKNKGNLLISDLWPQKIQKNYLKQTNLDETRRFIVGMANGQKGINVVKNYQKKNSAKKPDNFNKFKVISGYEQQKYMQKQEKNIITQIHQKVKYLEGGGIGPCEGQKEFQKIGIKNFTMKQEIIEQNGFINFLKQKIQQLGGDQQEAGQLYIYAVNKIRGRQMLTEIFNQIRNQKLNKEDKMIQDEKKKFNIKLNKMMDKLKILEKDNLQDFQYIEKKSKKMEDNMFKHAKSNSKWSNIYDAQYRTVFLSD